MGEGLKVERSRVSDGLSRLVKMIIGTHPVEDPHTKEVDQDVRATLPPSTLFADCMLPAKGIHCLYLKPRAASFIHYPLGLALG